MEKEFIQIVTQGNKVGVNISDDYKVENPVVPIKYDEIIIDKKEDEDPNIRHNLVGVETIDGVTYYDVYKSWTAGGPPLDAKAFVGYNAIGLGLTEYDFAFDKKQR